MTLEAGKRYSIRLDYHEFVGDAGIQLVWSRPPETRATAEREALDAARSADAVVMVLGLTPRLEGEEMKVPVEGFEGGDRVMLGIPQIQDDLLKKVVALGKPTVLVLLNGSAVAVNWAKDNVPAIVDAWYPGQAGGTAIADVLFGDYNPADAVSQFDRLYRRQLVNLYRLLGLAVPAALDQPISVGRGAPEAGGVMRRATAN